jgi:zinc transporter ZupT
LQSIKGKGAAGYLNLIGSTIHNTIDGLSIGLAFSAGVSTTYVPIVIAIFIH